MKTIKILYGIEILIGLAVAIIGAYNISNPFLILREGNFALIFNIMVSSLFVKEGIIFSSRALNNIVTKEKD